MPRQKTNRNNNTNNNNNSNKNQNYIVVNLYEKTNFKEIYNNDLNHTKFYNDIKDKNTELKGLWKNIINEEIKTKKSRFYKNFERLTKQSSFGIEQVLEDISESSAHKTESVYANAVDEETLKEKFKNAVYTEEPLSLDQKKALHEAIQADGAVQRGLSFWREFLLGEEFTVLFGVKKKLNEEKENMVSDRIINHPDLVRYLDRLQDIDNEVELRKGLHDLCDNLFGYGRGVLLMLFNDDKIPVRLIPLSSHKLSKVWIDKNTFEFLGVEYQEINDKKNILLANDILYFYINDNNVTPNSRYYGTSVLFSVLALAETNRLNRERNFPEIIRRRWASTLLIKTSTRNANRNQQIVNEVNTTAGGAAIIPDLVSAENIKIDTEMTSLINYANESDKKITRDMKLPIIAAGFGSVESRQNAQAELHQWTESTLKDLRSMINDVLIKKWYEPNLKRIIEFDLTINPIEEQRQTVSNEIGAPLQEGEGIGEENIIKNLGFDINDIEKAKRIMSDIAEFKEDDKEKLDIMVMKKLAQIATDIYTGVLTPSPTDIISLTDQVKFPWKIFIEYTNIVFDTFLDRAAGIIGYKRDGIIDREVGLDLANLGKYKILMKKKWAEEDKKKEEQRKAQLEAFKEQQTNNQSEENQQETQPIAESEAEATPTTNEQESTSGGTSNIGQSITNKISSRTTRGKVSA